MTKGTYKHTPEIREKISASKRGIKRSKEFSEKMSKIRTGTTLPEETKKKISESMHGQNAMDKNPHWNGGRATTSNGYIIILSPDHPFASESGYVREHRLVMEAHMGRTLLDTEVVHHINGIKDDNRIENLMLFSTTGEHTRHHKMDGDLDG